MYGMTNAGGGGSGSFKKTATGSLSPAAEFIVSDLSFRPRIVILYGEYYGTSTNSYVCIGLFEKNGDLVLWRPSYKGASVSPIDPSVDIVAVSDNGFYVNFGQLGNGKSKWPTGSSGATVTYFCYG